MTKFILVSGKARHGKDTAGKWIASGLETHGKSVVIAHFADLLKYICTKFFAWDGIKDEHGRSFLQYVGTGKVRKANPNYWVEFIGNLIKMFPDEFDYVVIPDARFPNEIDHLGEMGFDTISVRVERPGFDNGLTAEQKNHASETALDDYEFDYVIENTTMDNFLDNVVEVVNTILSREVK